MKMTALAVLVTAAALLNLVGTGFTQDAAYRSFEALDRNDSRYSAMGSALVPFAAQHTSVQFAAALLPVLIGALSARRRWPLATATTLILSAELVVLAWCWTVRALAAMPFTQG
jgi:phosphotransferase system  glucose/maltose/N-acetylglucosamine-specific IIC component